MCEECAEEAGLAYHSVGDVVWMRYVCEDGTAVDFRTGPDGALVAKLPDGLTEAAARELGLLEEGRRKRKEYLSRT